MKVGVACTSFFKEGGAMERQAYAVVRGLLDRGVKTTLFARRVKTDSPLVKDLDNVVLVKNWPIGGKLGGPLFSRKIDKGRRSLGLDLILACCKIKHSDLVLCGGTHMGMLEATGKRAGFGDNLVIDTEKWQYSGARHVFACSGQVRDELIRLYDVNPEKVTVAYPTVAGPGFAPVGREERDELRRRFGFAAGRTVILLVSCSHTRRGMRFLRSFFERTGLPVELVVAGRGARAGKNIRALGYVHNIERLYQAVDATMVASRYEPFGLAGVESALCGTPVLLSDRAGCREVLSGPGVHRFIHEDARSLARAMQLVMARTESPDPVAAVGYDHGGDAFVDELIRYF